MGLKSNQLNYRTEFCNLLIHNNLVGHSVEIGVAEGRFSEHIISWPNVTKHYMIDAWQTLNQKGDGGFEQNWHDDNLKEALYRTNAFENKRYIYQGKSSDTIPLITDNSLIFAYLDGDHSYKGCLADLKAIYPKVRSGGVISGHDYLSPQYGVNEAVKCFVSESNNKYTMSDIHTTFENGDDSMVSFWFIKK
jgi:hypothetical protein